MINILSQVSIIEYARKADIKKGLNDRFKEIYPHVELSLTKLDKSVTSVPCPLSESAPDSGLTSLLLQDQEKVV